MSEQISKSPRTKGARRLGLAGAVAVVLALSSVPALLPTEAFADTTVGGVISEDASGATSNVAAKDPQVDAAVAALESGTEDPTGTVTYNSVTITGQMQQTSYWCVPASARATLTAFGVTKYQSELAPLLGTTSSGTKMSKIPGVLNGLETRNKYVLNSNTSSSTQLFARVEVNADYYNAPIIAGVQGNDLPLWAAEGYYGYHAIVLYGYASNNAWIQYDDPIDIDSLYGRHVTNKSNLYSGIQDEQNYIVW